jgi:probable phosphoglycerate mutase
MTDGGDPERQLYLVRHGQTEWALLGRHTGRTDIPLDDVGRAQAETLGRRLAGHRFALVLSSPERAALETARLAGYADTVEVDDDLREWDYGELEGLTTPEIRERYPDWSIWTGPWPGGETPTEVGDRADRVIARCLDPSVDGDALLFAHGHLLRVLAARWVRRPATAAGCSRSARRRSGSSAGTGRTGSSRRGTRRARRRRPGGRR